MVYNFTLLYVFPLRSLWPKESLSASGDPDPERPEGTGEVGKKSRDEESAANQAMVDKGEVSC